MGDVWVGKDDTFVRILNVTVPHLIFLRCVAVLPRADHNIDSAFGSTEAPAVSRSVWDCCFDIFNYSLCAAVSALGEEV